jgi:DNA-binding HxlR family transcriptional regulator
MVTTRRPRAGGDAAALCPYFQAAMDLLGRRWTGLIIAALSAPGGASPGRGGPVRFSALRARLPALGDRMLAARLRELEARGLVVRRVTAGPPVRVAYALTQSGRAFGRVARAISRWGQSLARPARRKRGA